MLRRTKPRQRVVVVEDDPATSRMLEQVLKLEGFDVVTWRDGATAFARIRAAGCQAVILDLHLPGADGAHIARQIRSSPDTSSTPILMVTGDTDDRATWAGWKAGVNYYMAKPFDPQELIRMVRRVIEN